MLNQSIHNPAFDIISNKIFLSTSKILITRKTKEPISHEIDSFTDRTTPNPRRMSIIISEFQPNFILFVPIDQ